MELENLSKAQLAAIAVVLIKRISKIENAIGPSSVSKSDKSWLEELVKEAEKIKIK